MRVGSLCSGIGGLELGLERAWGAETVWHAEVDEAASAVLAARWPGVPNVGDLRNLNDMTPVDVLTAGYPCQPFSHAGRRKGTDDPRHLWPHVAAAVRHLRPALVVLENVPGHLSLGFGDVLGDLAEAGYDAEWRCLRASDVGCCHRRERVFIAAYTDGHGTGPEPGGSGAETPAGPLSGAQRRGTAGPVLGGGPAPDASHFGRQRGGRARQRGTGPEDSRRSTAADTDERGRGTGEPDLHSGEPDPQGGAPADADGQRQPGWAEHHGEPPAGRVPERQPRMDPDGHVLDWGPFAGAIGRQEQWHGPAPLPTIRRKLNPTFVEWMMGYPAGWVTEIITNRNAALRCLGNAVVPQVSELFARSLALEAAAA